MSDLSPARVQESRVFSHVDTDFCGPFLVKKISSTKRNAKFSQIHIERIINLNNNYPGF